MLTLKNEFITANFKTMGGELTSLVCNDREYIWQRDPKFWKGACPLMFPICGGLKDGVCYIDGKEYSIEKHGYARFKEFEVYEQTENSITLTVKEYIHAVELDGEYIFDDNYFSLMPNETRTVKFRPTENALTKDITVTAYTVK